MHCTCINPRNSKEGILTFLILAMILIEQHFLDGSVMTGNSVWLGVTAEVTHFSSYALMLHAVEAKVKHWLCGQVLA